MHRLKIILYRTTKTQTKLLNFNQCIRLEKHILQKVVWFFFFLTKKVAWSYYLRMGLNWTYEWWKKMKTKCIYHCCFLFMYIFVFLLSFQLWSPTELYLYLHKALVHEHFRLCLALCFTLSFYSSAKFQSL